jgi:mannosyl-3-phosphoglycerate phosphatase
MILTDLDHTLLEGDATLSSEARGLLRELREAGEAVVPLTSKTRDELARFFADTGCGGLGSFENGAAILDRQAVTVLPGAVPAPRLRRILGELREATALSLVPIDELHDDDLASLTGLDAARGEEARRREWDLPFLSPEDAGPILEEALGRRALRLVHGGTFWHLTGTHDKGSAARWIIAREKPRRTVGLGDSPADAAFLNLVDVPVIVPRREGPDARLLGLVPRAVIAPAPGGTGWAAAVRRIVLETPR